MWVRVNSAGPSTNGLVGQRQLMGTSQLAAAAVAAL
jgi:hypothetical protein